MAGHNKWTQIKHQKGAADKKRGLLFSKILKAIAIAAREEQNPDFNPRLRSIIQKAREENVPNDTIERALSKSTDEKDLEELTLEAYGPAGIAFLIMVITNNRNRTVSEVRHLLFEYGGKLAEPKSVRWAFEGDVPKFPQQVSSVDLEKIQIIIHALESHDDVQKVVTNALMNHES